MADLAVHLGFRLSNEAPAARTDIDPNARYKGPLIRPNETRYGTLPRVELDVWADVVHRRLAESDELRKALSTADNAQKMYVKTRQPPSKDAVRRGKALDDSRVHFAAMRAEEMVASAAPRRGAASVGDAATAVAYKNTLSAYRPTVTIFESAAVASSSGATANADAVRAVTELRRHQAPALAAAAARRERRAAAASKVTSIADITGGMSVNGRFSDDEDEDAASRLDHRRRFFISYEGAPKGPSGRSTPASEQAATNAPSSVGQLDSSLILDLTGDSSGFNHGATKKARGFSAGKGLLSGFGEDHTDPEAFKDRSRTERKFWDKKKKRYVTAAVNPNLATQSARRLKRELEGKDFSAMPVGKLYEKWSKSTRQRIQGSGERETTATAAQEVGRLLKKGRVMTGTNKARFDPRLTAKNVRDGDDRPGPNSSRITKKEARGRRTQDGRARSAGEVLKLRDERARRRAQHTGGIIKGETGGRGRGRGGGGR